LCRKKVRARGVVAGAVAALQRGSTAQEIFIAGRFEIIAASKIPDLNASQCPLRGRP
jgi:hypothetical protein